MGSLIPASQYTTWGATTASPFSKLQNRSKTTISFQDHTYHWEHPTTIGSSLNQTTGNHPKTAGPSRACLHLPPPPPPPSPNPSRAPLSPVLGVIAETPSAIVASYRVRSCRIVPGGYTQVSSRR